MSTRSVRVPSWQIIKFVRAVYWVAPLYILAILVKIYYIQRPALNNFVHILAVGIFFGAMCVLTILRQSRNEGEIQRQWKHLFSSTALIGIIYGLCCVLFYAFSGKWTFPYL